jgi:alkylhydroperoxidase family enzyme
MVDPDAPAIRALEDRGGEVKNLYRSLANHPVLLDAWTDFAWTLRFECRTPRTLRELLVLRAAQLTNSKYLWEDHVRFGREVGLQDQQMAALRNWRTSDMFTASEKTALEFAEQLITSGTVSDEGLSALRSEFDAGEVVELALTVSFYAMAPRVLAALRVPLQDFAPTGGWTLL